MSAQQQIRIAVLFGGQNSEHAISCQSALSIVNHLDRSRFCPIGIKITHQGRWIGLDDLLTPHSMTLDDDDAYEVIPCINPAHPGQFLYRHNGQLFTQVDVVFPILHGPYGEDGTIQGVLELMGIPYVGPGVLASAVGMDKEFTKKILSAAGLPIGPYTVLQAHTLTLNHQDRARLGLPVFVKPARCGSSYGISQVRAWEDLDSAIDQARQYDSKVIIEAAIEGREIECGVLEWPDRSVQASPLGEIILSQHQDSHKSFYDFDTKYLTNTAQLSVPALVEPMHAKQIQSLAIQAFHALGCQGLSRVDFFLTQTGPVINEINTMPGFTNISMFPQMWQAHGIDYSSLLSLLVDTALAHGPRLG